MRVLNYSRTLEYSTCTTLLNFGMLRQVYLIHDEFINTRTVSTKLDNIIEIKIFQTGEHSVVLAEALHPVNT